MLIALLALCHLVWSHVLVAPLHTCLSCSCMFSCLFVCVIKHCSKYWFCVGSHPSLYMKSWDLLLEALHVGTCVVCNSIQWIYGHQIQTYIFPLWIFSLFICLFDSMLPSFAYLCVFISFLFLCYVLACLLALLLCVCYMWWMEHARNF